jgi:hypothetical protein
MRFRPRFSVRTLAVVVTLVCAYFGAWAATKRYGVPAVPAKFPVEEDTGIIAAGSPTPCLVWRDEFRMKEGGLRRKYYLWLFGPTVKLPFDSKPSSESERRVESMLLQMI